MIQREITIPEYISKEYRATSITIPDLTPSPIVRVDTYPRVKIIKMDDDEYIDLMIEGIGSQATIRVKTDDLRKAILGL